MYYAAQNCIQHCSLMLNPLTQQDELVTKGKMGFDVSGTAKQSKEASDGKVIIDIHAQASISSPSANMQVQARLF